MTNEINNNSSIDFRMEDQINYLVEMKREQCFYDNLQNKHNITKENFKDAKFGYCGAYTAKYANEDSVGCVKVKLCTYNNDFKTFWKDKQDEMKEIIKIEKRCLCNQPIKNNFFIYSKTLNKVLSLGKCCIKKFNPDGIQKHCENCHSIHRNRSDNLCSDCRKKCSICRREERYKYYYSTCLECFKKMEKPCFECGVEKKNSYIYCYKCNLKINENKSTNVSIELKE